jgi:hypothetical protein
LCENTEKNSVLSEPVPELKERDGRRGIANAAVKLSFIVFEELPHVM